MRNIPTSRVKGSFHVGENVLKDHEDRERQEVGLVEDMRLYREDVDLNTLSPAIIDFYERTTSYRLLAKVKWKAWFKPFAAVYRLLSKRTEQINLPLSGKEVEMTGDIVPVSEETDGRYRPRAWVRKIGDEVCFVAIYSFHKTNQRTYMNIGLPLPFSTMTGVLELHQKGSRLSLSSKRLKSKDADSGTYLKTRLGSFKLPIEEYFLVEEVGEGALHATHNMWLWSIPFLTITYCILPKSE
ncbi:MULTISPECIES: hypothetical protein [Pontibacillus]|uniref:DUF4166 domain-containing protein n=1 Tax=Pontibacillus chungwhensis TaxID=265426 RepID=A0ABY8USW7_9BACI|nr:MULTISPECIES: hypothetical protein [Pontibacillus]MCD5323390.1 hypothetical protein [Pontibacillus sp. HN14]WIF96771.1 hypothetical protein QNI29_13540 [Pontibacillus chungwhensis]